MKTTKLLITAVITAGLILSVSAEQGGEKVDMKSLPPAVQKTIKEKAGEGKVVRIHREDDTNGKWNYEVTVKTDGKDWRFEVDPNGKFVKKHE